MKKLKSRFSLLPSLTYLLLVSSICQAKEQDETLIRWIQLDQPPAFIVKGNRQGQGFVDYVQKRLQGHLTDYDHYSLLVNSARHKAMLNNNENLCLSYLEYFPDLPTLAQDKEGNYLRSLPWSPHPTLELLMKRSFAENLLNTKKHVQLETILQNKDLILGLPSKRWKGQINKLVKKHEKNIPYVWNASQDFGSIFQMILKDRVNYTMAYPLWISYWEKEYHVPNGTMISLPLEEMKYPYIRVAVGCKNNDWGKKIITKVNQFLKTEVPSIAWRENMERWLPEEDIATFREYYNTMLLESYGYLEQIK